ncbi:cache domain-containing protein [Patulibacter defluvii]|uniref:cache domain-containing protein n=1 Tax=Patulibacter defluvii TaxID=3095358 RepID=UPI002A75E0F8|nr:cache domain-containing protein [Patulibacter sp. DM4]
MSDQRSASAVGETAAAADTIAALLEDVFAAVAPLQRTVERVLAPGPGRVASHELGIEREVAELLSDPDLLAASAGFVAAPGVLADRDRWLEWWKVDPRDRSAPPERVNPEAAPDGTTAFDYRDAPWLVVPRETGERHVTGPYVDYFCLAEYALTLTLPVAAGGVFAGVVGADVSIADVERRLADLLEPLATPAVLVNTSGRVLAAVGLDLITGDLLRDAPPPSAWSAPAPAPWRAVARCGTLPLAVLVGA